MNRSGILIADDNKNVLTALDLLLSREFSNVKCISNPNLILSEVKENRYDAVLLDMNFKTGQRSGNEGLFWLKEILSVDPDISVVMITAFGDIELAVNALKNGAVDFVLKPWDNQKLIATMLTASRLTTSRREVNNLKKEKESLKTGLKSPDMQIIGKSPPMEEVFRMVKKVAVTPAEVLITGENGTGKELIAKEIHRFSKRADKIFVAVDMGSIPGSLFESELFGHKKGAFTDAHSDRCGKIEAAHGGTLFLDEIGNLSLDLQAKLLGVLQNRTITRLGDNKPVELDTRLICATNKNLLEMVEKGEFRMDLLYRINTIQIEIPPLRKRANDILLLADFYLKKFTARYDKHAMKLGKSAEKVLKSWHWPGNVRELQHCIERAVILADTNELEASDLNLSRREDQSFTSFEGSLEDVESRLIAWSIREHGGNLSAVASRLGISRQTLYNKISKYGLQEL